MMQIGREAGELAAGETLDTFDVRIVVDELTVSSVSLVAIQVKRGDRQLCDLEPMLAVIWAR
jgi:hypothetical protein